MKVANSFIGLVLKALAVMAAARGVWLLVAANNAESDTFLGSYIGGWVSIVIALVIWVVAVIADGVATMARSKSDPAKPAVDSGIRLSPPGKRKR